MREILCVREMLQETKLHVWETLRVSNVLGETKLRLSKTCLRKDIGRRENVAYEGK